MLQYLLTLTGAYYIGYLSNEEKLQRSFEGGTISPWTSGEGGSPSTIILVTALSGDFYFS